MLGSLVVRLYRPAVHPGAIVQEKSDPLCRECVGARVEDGEGRDGPPGQGEEVAGAKIGALYEREGNKNRLSSTTCGEELQKIFKDWQSFKELYQKVPKRFTDFKRFAFLTFFDL